jgi:hypothetical protein
MRKLAIAIAGALALAAAAAGATDDKTSAGSNAPTPGKSSGMSKGTSKADTGAPVSGNVVSTDPSALVITVVVPSGEEQQLAVAEDAQITRDGARVAIIQIQSGDDVQASFDPSTHKVSRLDVKSKGSSKSKGDQKQKDGSQQKESDSKNK